MPAPLQPTPKGLKAIAALELAKGALALLAGIGFLATLGEDWGQAIEKAASHIAPGITFSQHTISILELFDRGQQQLVAFGLLAYAAIRLVEGFGLWKSQTWAEWLGAISGAIYIPFEIYELSRRPNWITLAIMAVNFVIVAYLIAILRTNSARKAEASSPSSSSA